MRLLDRSDLPNKGVQATWIEARFSIVFPTEFESRKSIFIGGQPAAKTITISVKVTKAGT